MNYILDLNESLALFATCNARIFSKYQNFEKLKPKIEILPICLYFSGPIRFNSGEENRISTKYSARTGITTTWHSEIGNGKQKMLFYIIRDKEGNKKRQRHPKMITKQALSKFVKNNERRASKFTFPNKDFPRLFGRGDGFACSFLGCEGRCFGVAFSLHRTKTKK